jgi:hypothetical protein
MTISVAATGSGARPTVEVTRGRRARALGVDFAILAATMLGATVVASCWMLIRTSAGRFDLGAGDAAIAFGMVMAPPAAWSAWLALATCLDGATPGQRRAGLVVAGGPWARLVRLALHPFAIPTWTWLAVIGTVAVIPVLPLLFLAMAIMAGLGGAASLILVLRAPSARGIHDLVSGTRLVVR